MRQKEARARVTIVNVRGLHARAAGKFVKMVGEFDAEVTVAANGAEVSGSSIMGLMMLAVEPGCELELHAMGTAAEGAVAALVELVQNKFDET